MKKALSLIMTVALMLGLLAAVPAGAEQNAIADAFGWEVPAEPLKISVFYYSDNFSTGEEQVRGIAAMQAYLKDYFNIDFEYTTTDGDAQEALNLALTGNDYPDVIVGASTTLRQRFVDQGRVAEITEYMNAETCPNLMGRLGDMAGLYADSEGKYYYLPTSFSNLMDLPDYSAHLRLDELKAAGIDYSAIKTPEDFFNAAMAIYNANPTTADGETRYSLGLYNQGMPEYLSGYWGLERGWQINDDNTLTYWTQTEAGKKMAQYFNNWYRTGTMDPDAFTDKWADLKTKVSQKREVALIGGWWIGLNGGSEVWRLTDDNWTKDETYICVGFKDADAENAYVTMKNNAGSSWTFITDKCENVAGVMKWLDFIMSDKGIALVNWGMPGEVESYKNPGTYTEIWHLNEDGTWYFNEDAKAQLVAETWDYNEEGIYGANSGLFNNLQYQGRFEDGEHCLWANQMWYSENEWKNIMFTNMSGTIFDGTDLLFESLPMSEDVTFAKTAVEDAWKQYYPLVIRSESDEEFEQNWQNLQAAVESAGLETYAAYRTANYQNNLSLMSAK